MARSAGRHKGGEVPQNHGVEAVDSCRVALQGLPRRVRLVSQLLSRPPIRRSARLCLPQAVVQGPLHARGLRQRRHVRLVAAHRRLFGTAQVQRVRVSEDRRGARRGRRGRSRHRSARGSGARRRAWGRGRRQGGQANLGNEAQPGKLGRWLAHRPEGQPDLVGRRGRRPGRGRPAVAPREPGAAAGREPAQAEAQRPWISVRLLVEERRERLKFCSVGSAGCAVHAVLSRSRGKRPFCDDLRCRKLDIWSSPRCPI
mmetsp:Transcript_103924/g.333127  ORF Transcript_103924/g.333127 Transcript_103924/m.333127 type:complete len:257 (+) Transcript_103924:811-1581(+)